MSPLLTGVLSLIVGIRDPSFHTEGRKTHSSKMLLPSIGWELCCLLVTLSLSVSSAGPSTQHWALSSSVWSGGNLNMTSLHDAGCAGVNWGGGGQRKGGRRVNTARFWFSNFVGKLANKNLAATALNSRLLLSYQSFLVVLSDSSLLN